LSSLPASSADPRTVNRTSGNTHASRRSSNRLPIEKAAKHQIDPYAIRRNQEPRENVAIRGLSVGLGNYVSKEGGNQQHQRAHPPGCESARVSKVGRRVTHRFLPDATRSVSVPLSLREDQPGTSMPVRVPSPGFESIHIR
jgi:hypothetical protein